MTSERSRTRTEEPLLSAAEEVELARRIEAGLLAAEALRVAHSTGAAPGSGPAADLQQLAAAGEAARERFLLANIRLVAMEVRRAAGRTPVAGDDLFQEGALALAESLIRWDHTRGIRFAGYALPWIRNRIRGAAAARVGELESASRAGQVRRLRGEQVRLTQRLRREPTLRELAAAVDRSVGWVADTLQVRVASPLHDGSGRPLELADPAAEAPLAELTEPVWPAAVELARLPEPLRTVLRRRFGFDGPPANYTELAAELGRSPGQVRRLEQQGLELLREVCPCQARRAAS